MTIIFQLPKYLRRALFLFVGLALCSPLPGDKSVAAKPLGEGGQGLLVSDLQRTLNARLSPSPKLKVNGKFGSTTREAVERFQKDKQLPVSGKVDKATWQALGLLVTSSPPADPKTVNAAKLTRAPPDDLAGRPFVTCKAWAIADGATGKFLWGHNETTRRHFASTTKMMTAYIVLNLAEQDPRVLKEEMVFSRRADNTGGSTAGVREGEIIAAGELLYGLLLPSGNDASVALAEQFGQRFQPAEEETDKKIGKKKADKPDDPLDRFVAEMNRTAARLGMEDTRFANPHGLTARGHQSTARDLLRLVHAAWQLPQFRHYTSTRQHGVTVASRRGYRRNIIWKNTNRLLAIDGYDGVKTGTTSAAGACLVSSSRRGADHLLLVVLGSAASDARYTDTRNLFRWAWNERKKQSGGR